MLALLAVPALAQTPAPAPQTPKPAVEAAPITEVESLKMHIAQLTEELGFEGKARRAAEEQRDTLRMQLTMIQTAPVREGFTYDWEVGKFRHRESGKVWDFETKALIADDKTPKDPASAKPEDKPKSGGGL